MLRTNSSIVVDIPEARQVITTLNKAKEGVIKSYETMPPSVFADSALKGSAADAAVEVAQKMYDELRSIADKCDELVAYMEKAIDDYQRSDKTLSGSL